MINLSDYYEFLRSLCLTCLYVCLCHRRHLETVSDKLINVFKIEHPSSHTMQ